jgi:hypothetical protein
MSNLYDCPRCGGDGTFTIEIDDGSNGVSERCRPCGGTAKVTPEDWQPAQRQERRNQGRIESVAANWAMVEEVLQNRDRPRIRREE